MNRTSFKKTSLWILGTGFSRGIGYEIAKIFHSKGFKLAHIGRTVSGLEDLFFPCDLAQSPSNIDNSLQSIPDFLNSHHVYGLVYAAGFMPQLSSYSFEQLSPCTTATAFLTSQEKALRVNYLSYAYLAQTVLPLLQRQPATELSTEAPPFVAHLNSLAAVDPLIGLELYGSSKAAALAHSAWLSSSCTPQQAHILAIHPGTVKTDMVAQGIFESQAPATLKETLENFEKSGGFTTALQAAQNVVGFLLGANEFKDQAHGKLYLADSGITLQN